MAEAKEYVIENGPLIDYNNEKWNNYDYESYDNIVYHYVIENDALNFLLGGRYIGADVDVYKELGYTPEQSFNAHALSNFYGYIK